MKRTKWILWTLALLVIVGIGTTVIVRHQRQQKEAAVAQAKKDKKKKIKSESEKETAEEPAPAPKMEAAPIVVGPAAKTHLAEQAFIAALREILLWRSNQPDNPETKGKLLEKLSAIDGEALPAEQKNAWKSLLQGWKSASDPAKAIDPQLKVQRQQAAGVLNAMFKAHGDGDIVL